MDKQSLGYGYFPCQLFFIYHCQISLLDKEKYNGSSYNSDKITNYDETAMPLGQGGQKPQSTVFYITITAFLLHLSLKKAKTTAP